jgi:hypothetical protein
MGFAFSQPITTKKEDFAAEMSVDIAHSFQNTKKAGNCSRICEKLGINFPIIMHDLAGYRANFAP